jgi:hypothetical protein
MSANVEAMVREGAAALKAGRKDEARTLLLKAVELDPYNEDGWLWLSGLVDSVDDQRTCLENVLAINPNNQRAQQGLAYLNRSQSAPGMPAPTPAFNTAPTPPPAPSAPPPPPPTAGPSGSPSSGDFDPFASAFTETSVSWDDPGIATSSASSYRPVNEPSADLLDDWVSGLGLSTEAGRTNTPAPAPGAVTSPFTDINFGSDDDEGSDIFSSGPFDISTPIEPAAPPPAAALLTPEPPPAAKKGAQRLSPAVDDGLSSTAGKSSALASTDLIAEAFSGTFTPMKETDFRDSESSTGFDSIPAEIKATRIPGTDGERPFTLVAAVVLLAILNMGAAVMLMLRLLA